MTRTQNNRSPAPPSDKGEDKGEMTSGAISAPNQRPGTFWSGYEGLLFKAFKKIGERCTLELRGFFYDPLSSREVLEPDRSRSVNEEFAERIEKALNQLYPEKLRLKLFGIVAPFKVKMVANAETKDYFNPIKIPEVDLATERAQILSRFSKNVDATVMASLKGIENCDSMAPLSNKKSGAAKKIWTIFALENPTTTGNNEMTLGALREHFAILAERIARHTVGAPATTLSSKLLLPSRADTMVFKLPETANGKLNLINKLVEATESALSEITGSKESLTLIKRGWYWPLTRVGSNGELFVRECVFAEPSETFKKCKPYRMFRLIAGSGEAFGLFHLAYATGRTLALSYVVHNASHSRVKRYMKRAERLGIESLNHKRVFAANLINVLALGWAKTGFMWKIWRQARKIDAVPEISFDRLFSAYHERSNAPFENRSSQEIGAGRKLISDAYKEVHNYYQEGRGPEKMLCPNFGFRFLTRVALEAAEIGVPAIGIATILLLSMSKDSRHRFTLRRGAEGKAILKATELLEDRILTKPTLPLTLAPRIRYRDENGEWLKASDHTVENEMIRFLEVCENASSECGSGPRGKLIKSGVFIGALLAYRLHWLKSMSEDAPEESKKIVLDYVTITLKPVCELLGLRKTYERISKASTRILSPEEFTDVQEGYDEKFGATYKKRAQALKSFFYALSESIKETGVKIYFPLSSFREKLYTSALMKFQREGKGNLKDWIVEELGDAWALTLVVENRDSINKFFELLQSGKGRDLFPAEVIGMRVKRRVIPAESADNSTYNELTAPIFYNLEIFVNVAKLLDPDSKEVNIVPIEIQLMTSSFKRLDTSIRPDAPDSASHIGYKVRLESALTSLGDASTQIISKSFPAASNSFEGTTVGLTKFLHELNTDTVLVVPPSPKADVIQIGLNIIDIEAMSLDLRKGFIPEEAIAVATRYGEVTDYEAISVEVTPAPESPTKFIVSRMEQHLPLATLDMVKAGHRAHFILIRKKTSAIPNRIMSHRVLEKLFEEGVHPELFVRCLPENIKRKAKDRGRDIFTKYFGPLDEATNQIVIDSAISYFGLKNRRDLFILLGHQNHKGEALLPFGDKCVATPLTQVKFHTFLEWYYSNYVPIEVISESTKFQTNFIINVHQDTSILNEILQKLDSHNFNRIKKGKTPINIEGAETGNLRDSGKMLILSLSKNNSALSSIEAHDIECLIRNIRRHSGIDKRNEASTQDLIKIEGIINDAPGALSTLVGCINDLNQQLYANVRKLRTAGVTYETLDLNFESVEIKFVSSNIEGEHFQRAALTFAFSPGALLNPLLPDLLGQGSSNPEIKKLADEFKALQEKFTIENLTEFYYLKTKFCLLLEKHLKELKIRDDQAKVKNLFTNTHPLIVSSDKTTPPRNFMPLGMYIDFSGGTGNVSE